MRTYEPIQETQENTSNLNFSNSFCKKREQRKLKGVYERVGKKTKEITEKTKFYILKKKKSNLEDKTGMSSTMNNQKTMSRHIMVQL